MKKSGYQGKDSMREKAERMFGSEFSGAKKASMTPPSSFSSRDKMKTRLYAKGGHVHGLSEEQSDMHIPRHAKTPPLNIESFAGEEHMKKGGHARKHHKHAYAFGGPGEGQTKFTTMPVTRETSLMKRGGKAKHHYGEGGPLPAQAQGMKRGGHHKRHHYVDGGSVMDAGDQQNRFGGIPTNPIGKNIFSKRDLDALPFLNNPTAVMKRGGHARKHHYAQGGYFSGGNTAGAAKGGDMSSYNRGGCTVYEKEMVGEHPSHTPHHYNYEKEMHGEHPKRARMHMGGAAPEMAMGGVGKMRHGVADKMGKPIRRRVNKGV